MNEKASSTQESMPYKFTSKEQDPETGLYYFGARYYDAKLSKWISTDPAVEKYFPGAGKGSDGLPGLGGVFNSANLDVYHYANNNPVKLIDPDGNETILEGLFNYAFSRSLLSHYGINSSAFTSPMDESALHFVSNAAMVSDVLTSPKFYGLYARGFVGAYEPVNLGPIKGEGGAYIFADTNNSVGITGRAVLTQGNNKFGPFATQYFMKNGEYTLESNIDLGSNYGNFLIRNMTDYTKFELGGKLGSWFGVEVRWNPNTMYNNFNNFFNSDSIFKGYIDYQYGGSSGGGSIYFGTGFSY